jgi:predicted aconitase with swiveling domain
MSTTFRGRPLLAGNCQGEALVSHGGFNTLASYEKALILHTRTAVCSDQNNPDLYKKDMAGKVICLPQTIGSTTGGLALMTACSLGNQPRAMLFADHIDSLAAAGVILSDTWLQQRIIVVDQLGRDFLDAVKSGQTLSVAEDGTVTVDQSMQ